MTFRSLPPGGGDARQVAEVVRGLMDGKSNNTGTVTLASGTSTTLTDARVGSGSTILLTPLTATAAALVPYVSARASGTATLTHANNAAADANYAYAIIG